MERFRQAYLRSCEQFSMEPSPSLMEMSDSNNAINLSKLSFGVKACEVLSEALKGDEFFISIDIGDSFIGDEGCAALSAALKQNVTVERLDLRGSHIRTEGAVALAHLLKNNHFLKSLNMEWNLVGIVDSGVHAIADALRTNQGLTHLDIRNNRIGPDAAVVLAQSLAKNPVLRMLDLRWNSIGLAGGQALAEMLEGNTTLTEILLTGNKVPEDLVRRIDELLLRNQQLFERRSVEAQVSHKLAHELNTVKSKYESEINQKELELHKSKQEYENLDRLMANKFEGISEDMVSLKTGHAEMEQKWRTEVRRHNETEKLYQETLEAMSKAQRDAEIYVTNARVELEREKELRSKVEDQLSEARVRLDEIQKDHGSERHGLQMDNQGHKQKISELQDDNLRLQDEMVRLRAQLEERTKDLEDRLRSEDVRRQKAEERARDAQLEQARLHSGEMARVRTESESTINGLHDTLKDVSSKKTHAEDKLHEAEVALSKERTARQSDTTIMKDMEERIRNLERQVDKASSDRDQSQSTVQALIAEKEKLKAASAANDKAHEATLAEERKCRETLIKDAQNLQAEIEALKQEKAKFVYLSEKSSYNETQLTEQIANERSAHESATKEIMESHLGDVKSWEQRVRDKDSEIANLRAKLEAKTNEVRNVRQENDRTLASLEGLMCEFIKSTVREQRVSLKQQAGNN